jgi:3,4-dihydroxy-2-butanone 4-phosphate synthase
LTEDFEGECDLVWAGSLLDMDKIIAMMEDCTKECCTCNRDDKDDCRLEMREAIHSMAKTFKTTIHSFIEFATKERKPVLPPKVPEALFT